VSLEPGSVASVWRLDIQMPSFSRPTLVYDVAVIIDGVPLLDPQLMIWVDGR